MAEAGEGERATGPKIMRSVFSKQRGGKSIDLGGCFPGLTPAVLKLKLACARRKMLVTAIVSRNKTEQAPRRLHQVTESYHHGGSEDLIPFSLGFWNASNTPDGEANTNEVCRIGGDCRRLCYRNLQAHQYGKYTSRLWLIVPIRLLVARDGNLVWI